MKTRAPLSSNRRISNSARGGDSENMLGELWQLKIQLFDEEFIESLVQSQEGISWIKEKYLKLN